jgi:TRAP-type C4-dicarboxylate transport system permease small subunit
MRRFLDRLYDAAGYLAAFFVFAICASMLVTTVMRESRLRTGGWEDVVSWFTAAAAFFGLAHTFKHGDFVRVELLLSNMKPPLRRGFELFALGMASVFIGYLAVSTSLYVYQSWSFGDMSGGLIVVPIWIPQSSFVVGSWLLFIAVIDELVIVLRGGKPTYVIAVEERHARGDFTEDV